MSEPESIDGVRYHAVDRGFGGLFIATPIVVMYPGLCFSLAEMSPDS
jgi:hypothetical protein